MAGTAEDVARLAPVARRLREHVIRMITAAGSGHPGGSLSAAEIVLVLQPADAVETEAAVEYLVRHEGPAYLRLTRQKVADVSPAGYRFECGKAVVLREGRDLAIAASGAVVGHAIAAAERLAAEGVQAAVLNVHTLKPLDAAAFAEWGTRTGALLTVEDHGIVGGLGSAACEALDRKSVV